ncbi:MAG: TMEM175 family protein, partial [Candidatus Bilamarchaeaceae archaeon]
MGEEQQYIKMGLGKNRAEALTDGIFAFAMTLLVLGIEVPEPSKEYMSADAVNAILQNIYPDFTHYIVAFIMLAGFWLLHHRCYDRLKVIDLKMLWMNIITLIFVALIPFSTDLADDYVEVPLAGMVFSANMFVVGVMLYLQWKYASRAGSAIAEELPSEHINAISKRMAIIPCIALIGIAL